MSRLAVLEQRFDALKPRERTLLSVAVGGLLAMALYVLWIEPVATVASEQREQVDTLAPQVAAEREALARVQQELARDPDAARRLLLQQLRAEASELDERLRTDEAVVIPPSRMPGVLRDLMGRDGRLRVIGVDALPPEVLRWSPTPGPAEIAEPLNIAMPALYRHRVVLRFEGDFAATLDYIRAVEALPLRIRLGDLEIDATDWPRLDITLQVETLGLEEGWIGV